jgi:flagellar hook assembly protein FlgD
VGQHKAMPFELMQNYPNPFNASTTVSFRLEARDWVRLYVTNLNGQILRTLVDGMLDSGKHQVQWDGTNQMQNVVSSGIYFVHLIVSDKREMTRILYLR